MMLVEATTARRAPEARATGPIFGITAPVLETPIAPDADAPHPDNAHKFINYIMEPQVIADVSNYVYYANGNSASFDLIDPEVTEDPAIYPPESAKANLYAARAHSQKYDRLLTRAWTRIRTGQ